MKWETVEVNSPGPGQVRLSHTAIGLNFVDVYYRNGTYPAPLPLILGREAVGVVETLGPGVTSLKVGDRVAYASVIGSYAESRLINAAQVIRLPPAIDDRTAAACTLQGMTALLTRVIDAKGFPESRAAISNLRGLQGEGWRYNPHSCRRRRSGPHTFSVGRKPWRNSHWHSVVR